MKMLMFFVVSFMSLAAMAKDCEPKVLLAENIKTAKAVFKELGDLKKDPELSELREPEGDIALMYSADINNDGKNEFIFTSIGSGSGGYINIYVFEKRGDKFVSLGEPPKPEGRGDGPWFFNWHRDKKTSQIQFLVGGCGATYMQFDYAPENKLERYLWKNGKTVKVDVILQSH